MNAEFDSLFINKTDFTSTSELLAPPENEFSSTDDQFGSSAEDGPVIPQPPPSSNFDTFDELFTHLQLFFRENHAAIVKGSSSGKKELNGVIQPTYYVLQCDRGPRRAPVSNPSRRTSTRGTNCPFKIIAKCNIKTNNFWVYEVKGRHNHLGSMDPSAHPAHRKRTEDQRRLQKALSRLISVRAREEADIIRAAAKEKTYFTQKDIYNDRLRNRHVSLGGFSATQAWIKILQDQKLKHWIKYDEEDNRVVAVFWTYPWCETQWQRFPQVLGLDNTYKTNRFKMPLFQITGLSDQQSVVNFAYGLINNEKEDAYLWLCRHADACRRALGLPVPSVVITDKEMALKNALSEVFPDAQQQLCVWHINTNVDAKIKTRWNPDDPDENEIAAADENGSSEATVASPSTSTPTPTENTTPRATGQTAGQQSEEERTHSRQGMFLMWKDISLYAEDGDDFNVRWSRLNECFPLQGEILRYISSEYMPWRIQWAKCFIKNYRNFGMRTNSPTESSHKDLKSFLVVGTGDLLHLHHAIVALLEKKERIYIQRAAENSIRQRRMYVNRSWLGDLPNKLAYKALELLAQQACIAVKALPDNAQPEPLRECTGCFTQQLALPCSHRILEHMQAGTSLLKEEIHPRWWLWKPLDLEEPLLRIRDPHIVQNLRGRPRRAINKKDTIPDHLQARGGNNTSSSSASSTPRSTPAANTAPRSTASTLRRPRQPRQSQSPHNTRPLNPSIRRTLTQAEVAQNQATSSPPTPSPNHSRTGSNTRGRGTKRGRGISSQTGRALAATPTPSLEEFIPATQSPLREEIVCAS